MKKPRELQIYKFATVLYLLLISAVFNQASANFGHIDVESITENSININWDWASASYEASGLGDPEDYKICYEPSGDWATICGGGTVNYSAVKNYMITGLSPDTSYKIRVKCHCKKGPIKRWRNVATITVKTNTAVIDDEPDYIPASIIINNTGFSSFQTKLTHNYMNLFEHMRICYRRKWITVAFNFKSECQSMNPASGWYESDKNLGWLDIVLGVSPYYLNLEEMSFEALITPLVDLKSCAKYQIVAYGVGGFVPPSYLPTQEIGETYGETQGPCHVFKMPVIIENDYSDSILLEYAKAVDIYYGMPLFEYLAQNYDQNLYQDRSMFVQLEHEDIYHSHTLLTYLIETGSSVFDQWQDSGPLKQAQMTLDDFVKNNYPVIYQNINVEINSQ
jgi:hypothetical protein